MNIGEITKQIVEELSNNGFNGFHFYDIEVGDDLSEDYGYITNFQADTWDESEYFDHAQFEYDLHQWFISHFFSTELRPNHESWQTKYSDGNITVAFYSKDEVEIYKEEGR